jgi:hypothetical protein
LLQRISATPARFVLVFALLLHAWGLGGEYVLDDTRAILGHPVVTGDAPLWEAFTREYWGRPFEAGWSSSWRPLTTLTFALEHHLTPEPWLHHGVNALAFALLCALVTRVVVRLGAARTALGVGLAFAALPIHVESVASIVGRADVLASLACLLAFDLVYERPKSAARLGGAGVLYLAGLLCKESVALFPGIVLWLGLLAWRRDRALGLGAFVPGIVVGVVGVGYLLLRNALLPVGLPDTFVAADNQLVELSGLGRWWGNLAVLGHYAELTAVPLRLCVDHTYADVVPPRGAFEHEAIWAWVGLGLALAIVSDAWRAWRGRSPGLWFAFGLSYLLIGQWVVDLSVILAERIALWPTVWLALAVAVWLVELTRSDEGDRRVRVIGAAILIALMSARTIERTLDWRDSVTVYESSAQACPAAVHNRFNLGDAMRKAGRPADAVWHFGLAAAGRHAYPDRFDVEAFDAERESPVEDRLPRLPELVGAENPRAFWAGLHQMFVREQSRAEADLVAEMATRADD